MSSHNFDVERIKQIPIHEVAMIFGHVKKEGVSYKTLCPWHNDHNPSLVLREGTNHNYCHCFPCGNGGDVIAYTRKMLGKENAAEGFVETCEWLCAQFNIPMLDSNSTTSVVRPLVKPASLPVTNNEYVPLDYVVRTVNVNNSLSLCVNQLFGPETACRVTAEYLLGLHANYYHSNATIFWSIDVDGRVHYGKYQLYDTDITSTHFASSIVFPLSNGDEAKALFLTPELKKKGIIPVDASLDTKCLFGEHLLRYWPKNKPVVLVESPKNAVLGAAAFPNCLWLAAGNKSNLNESNTAVLAGRCGYIYPDRDAINDWKERQSNLPALYGFEVKNFCDRYAPADCLKFDIADYIIGKMRKASK